MRSKVCSSTSSVACATASAEQPPPSNRHVLIKSLCARLKAHGNVHTSPEEMAQRHYGGKRVVLDALNDLPGLISRAAINPAMTTVATWAAELGERRKL